MATIAVAVPEANVSVPILLGKQEWPVSEAQLKKDAEAEKQYKTRVVFSKKPVGWRSGKYKGKPKRVTLNLDELYPSQSTVEADIVYLYYTGRRKNRKSKNPDVVVIDDKYVIADGHHRLTADVLKGKKKVRVNLYPVVVGVTKQLPALEFDKLVNRITRLVMAPELLKARRHLMRIEPGRPTVKVRRARRRLRNVVQVFFSKAIERVTGALEKNYQKIRKAKTPDEIAALAYDAIDWEDMVDDVEQILADIAKEGGMVGLGQLDIEDQELFATVNQGARDFARERAAELVGMRRNEDGELEPNPDAKWAISNTTRDDLRDVITHAFEQNTPIGQLVDDIKSSGIFSDSRAKMIANTEAAHAQVEGNLGAWRDSGVVQKVQWVTSGDHDVDDECDDFEADSPYDIGDVPVLPAHPNCLCALIPAD